MSLIRVMAYVTLHECLKNVYVKFVHFTITPLKKQCKDSCKDLNDDNFLYGGK